MKLIFVRVEPSKEFKKTVVSHGFSCSVLSSISNLSRASSLECIILGLSKVADIKRIEAVRKEFPDVWISAVVSKESLSDPEFHSSLIESDAKNAVWLEDSWELLFWFSYQQFLNFKEVSQRAKNAEKQLFSHQEKSSELSAVSNRLLDKFNKDIDLAENIQRLLRPRFSPQIPGISLSVKYIPSVEGGGDYYDVFEFGDKKRFGILLADSKTHGMAATLLSVLLKLRLEEMKDRFPDSKAFVSFLNREIRSVHTTKNEASMALFYGILDRASLSFQFCSAGALKPILWRQGSALTVPDLQNPDVGVTDHFEFREHSVSLQPGDLLILHTNGLEAPLKKGNLSGEDRILSLLKKGKKRPDPLGTQNELMGLVDEYTSRKKLKDDLTLIQLAVDERAIYVAKAEGD